MPLRQHPLLMESALHTKPPTRPSTTPHRQLQPQQFNKNIKS